MISKKEFENRAEIGAYADAFDYMLHYYEQGEGEPLLLIHGLGQSIHTFRRNIDELSKHFRVIALDLPGHGYSDKPEMEYTIEELTGAILVFLSVLRLDRVHIFAFSTGAVIAQNFATLYPEKVNRMILISPGGLTKGYPFLYRALGMPLLGDVLVTLGLKERGVESCLLSAYFDRTTVNEQMLEQVMAPYQTPEARDALATAIAHWDDREVYDHLNQIVIPTYIFWGECDTWHPMEMLDELAELMPYAFIATVRNAGHMLHEEKSREINRKVIECLTEPLIPEETELYRAEEDMPAPRTEAPADEAPVDEEPEQEEPAYEEPAYEEPAYEEPAYEEPEQEEPAEESPQAEAEETVEEAAAAEEPIHEEPEEEEESFFEEELFLEELPEDKAFRAPVNKLEQIRASFSQMRLDDFDLGE